MILIGTPFAEFLCEGMFLGQGLWALVALGFVKVWGGGSGGPSAFSFRAPLKSSIGDIKGMHREEYLANSRALGSGIFRQQRTVQTELLKKLRLASCFWLHDSYL